MNKYSISFSFFILFLLSGCGGGEAGAGNYSTSPAMTALNAYSGGGEFHNFDCHCDR